MTSKPEDKQPTNQPRPEPAKHHAAIENQVLHALGRPAGLQRMQVRRLWEDHYRVNVFIGVDATCTTVAHSYFLSADEEGNITASSPAITKQY